LIVSSNIQNLELAARKMGGLHKLATRLGSSTCGRSIQVGFDGRIRGWQSCSTALRIVPLIAASNSAS
jgi:hypothetical protein